MTMSPRPSVALAKDLRVAIRHGHPWIFDRALAARPAIGSGQVVRVTFAGEAVGAGYYDPDSALAVRILARDPDAALDDAWAAQRAHEAAQWRLAEPWLQAQSGLRLIHGENDDMPGLVIDRYGETAVAVLDGPAAAQFWQPRLDAVWAGLERAGCGLVRLWVRPIRGGADSGAGTVARGDGPPASILITEAEAQFEVDVRAGQKTGFFLDQRLNRRLVAELSAGAEVLNLFAYTGGFSVHAALAGARRVTSVDIAAPAVAAAERNFAHSGLDPAQHRFAAEDAFDFLARAGERGWRYDLVIVDPPSFAPSERAKPRALRAYGRLNRMALGVVEAGGWLVSASCSSHVTTTDMLSMLADAASAAGRRVRVVDIRGADRDHPVRPGFPEGRYLDLLVAAVV